MALPHQQLLNVSTQPGLAQLSPGNCRLRLPPAYPSPPWDVQQGPHLPPPHPQLAPWEMATFQLLWSKRLSHLHPNCLHILMALPCRFSTHPPLTTPPNSTPVPATTISPGPQCLEQRLTHRFVPSALLNGCMEQGALVQIPIFPLHRCVSWSK